MGAGAAFVEGAEFAGFARRFAGPVCWASLPGQDQTDGRDHMLSK